LYPLSNTAYDDDAIGLKYLTKLLV